MALTQKQEAFALAYFETGNASEAYRRSYNAENMSPNVIHNKASALMAKGDVRVRIEQLRAKAETASVMSRQEALERLSTFARTDLSDLVEFGAYELGQMTASRLSRLPGRSAILSCKTRKNWRRYLNCPLAVTGSRSRPIRRFRRSSNLPNCRAGTFTSLTLKASAWLTRRRAASLKASRQCPWPR